MTRTALKQIVNELDNGCHVLGLALPEIADPEVIALHLQRLLDFVQQKLDEQRPRFPETAGNHFRADRSGGQRFCIMCRHHWAPAGEEYCDRCIAAKPYVWREYTDEEREVYLREIEAIAQGRHQLIPSKEEEP